jgi:DNA-binding response OmpR family regulator
MAPSPANREAVDEPAAILVVEDDRSTRELLAAVLTDERLPFHVTASGHEAMDYAIAHPPSMVMLDMHLPNVQGEAIATALRIQCGQRLPILMMSAANERATAERLGAFAYVQKPFDLDELILRVRLCLAKSAESRELQRRSREARDRLRQAMARQRLAMQNPGAKPPFTGLRGAAQ